MVRQKNGGVKAFLQRLPASRQPARGGRPRQRQALRLQVPQLGLPAGRHTQLRPRQGRLPGGQSLRQGAAGGVALRDLRRLHLGDMDPKCVSLKEYLGRSGTSGNCATSTLGGAPWPTACAALQLEGGAGQLQRVLPRPDGAHGRHHRDQRKEIRGHINTYFKETRFDSPTKGTTG